MKFLIFLTLVFLVIILAGVGLLRLARLARQRNAEMIAQGKHEQSSAMIKAANLGRYSDALTAYFFGSLPKPQALAGKVIAIAGILFLMVFLLFAVIALINAS